MTVVFLERKVILGGALVVALAFVIGVLIGFYGKGDSHPVIESDTLVAKLVQDKFEDESDMRTKFIEKIDGPKLREFLKYLTAEPHIAALRRDQELTEWIKDSWEDMGLDRVELQDYNYFLTWPNQTNPNKIYLRDSSGQVQFTSKHKEEELREGDDHPDFVHAFNGYAPAGDVTGELVYVNYGRVEDFQKLRDDLGVSVEGKICIARYGKIYRGNKVHHCQNEGGIGIIMFSDPGDVAHLGTEPKDVYPNSIFLPGSGIQRGSTYIGDGDPLSPTWASVENAYRVKPEDVEGLPKIPAQPIGYSDAKIILEKMGGKESPEEWKGKIDGIDYKLGGEWLPEYSGWTLQLKVNNYQGTVKSPNVIGYIQGDVEPDRYVFLSNHRDAWGYGAVDPSSGTAQLMEVARVLGMMHKEGWKPRRTIVFASWAAEEYGLLGSYEYVFHKLNKLSDRTVGLVNTDICVSGPIAKPQASPILRDIVVEALKSASAPDEDPTEKSYFPTRSKTTSYYDFWYEWTNRGNSGKEKAPKITHLGSGSDHAAFAFYTGIPAVNLRFKDDSKKYPGIGQYPTYHTGYETFYLVDKIIDPGFNLHKICAQTSVHMLLNLADSLMIPYSLKHFPEEMKKALKTMNEKGVASILKNNGATLEHLEDAVEKFSVAVDEYTQKVQDMDKTNPMMIRIVNDQMMQLERIFVFPAGLPDRPDTRHAVFAPSKFNKYGASAFPGISDLLHEIDRLSEEERKKRWEEIKKHLSDLMIMVQSAEQFLKPVDEI